MNKYSRKRSYTHVPGMTFGDLPSKFYVAYRSSFYRTPWISVVSFPKHLTTKGFFLHLTVVNNLQNYSLHGSGSQAFGFHGSVAFPRNWGTDRIANVLPNNLKDTTLLSPFFFIKGQYQNKRAF